MKENKEEKKEEREKSNWKPPVLREIRIEDTDGTVFGGADGPPLS
ncbi:MAG: hypothetical protein SVY10_07120 [Thermodesulfobacteriota bacterium]|nr:hypothetical protein [Thermodesulfobacteriota bacterium]